MHKERMRYAAPATLALLMSLGATSLAAAACPAPLAGSTPEVLEANQQRLICLQQELELDTAYKAQDFQIDALQRAYDAQQLQRRFDQLPVFQPPAVQPPVFQPPKF
jgi:hypothetical protein